MLTYIQMQIYIKKHYLQNKFEKENKIFADSEINIIFVINFAMLRVKSEK